MARLITSGFETQILSSTANYSGEGESGVYNATVTGAPVFTTSVVRSGAAALEAEQAANNHLAFDIAGMTLDRAYFIRVYARFSDATPAAAATFLSVIAAGVAVGQVRLETNGTLTLRDTLGAVGSASSGLSDNTWYRVEMKIIIPTAGAGTLEAKLDGSTFATSAAVDVNNVVTTPSVRVGAAGGGTATVKNYIDDLAVNDDQAGTGQTDYPGSGKVVLLKPVSHSSIGNWVGPQTTGDDTTNLEQNVDNTPPLGIVHTDTDAAAGLYAFNITNAANQNFDLNVTDYTTAGITGSDTIKLCQALGRMSVNTTTGTNTGAVAGVSNPACTATTGKNLELTAVAGTEPIGWKSIRSAIAYAPSVTLGTSPVVRVQKEVANVSAAMVDLMGLLVEYQPPAPVATTKNLAALGVG